MSTFALVLVEEGIEADLPINLSNMLGFLDQMVPRIEHNNFGYQLASVTRATLGNRWQLNVKLVDLRNDRVHEEPVGCIEVQKTGNDTVNFRVPPRSEQNYPGMAKLDFDGVYYGSFCCQMINALYDRGLMHLPGRLPTF